jgi:hypothetical protein
MAHTTSLPEAGKSYFYDSCDFFAFCSELEGTVLKRSRSAVIVSSDMCGGGSFMIGDSVLR